MYYTLLFILALASGFCVAWAIVEIKKPAGPAKGVTPVVPDKPIFVPAVSLPPFSVSPAAPPTPITPERVPPSILPSPETASLKNKAAVAEEEALEDKLWHEGEVEYIFSLNEQLALSLNRNKIAKCIVESVYKFLSVQKAVLLLLDKDSQELRIEYSLGIENEVANGFFLKKEESISGFVMLKREPILTNDLDKEFYLLKQLNREDYLKKSFISIPVVFQNDVLGVLHVCDKKAGSAFVKRDLMFLTNVGKISSIALRSAGLQEQIQNDYLKTIAAFAKTLDARDSYTRWHSEHVTKYSLAIAGAMHCRHYEVEVIKQAALLHDIGKIGIRDNVLLKDGRLTDEEFNQIKSHPGKGEEIIKSLSFLKDASVLIRHHHEKYDGSGYPDGIKGNAIEIGARILAVADSFDAMTTDRPYRKQLALEEVLKELESKKGTQFDPAVVDAFLTILKQTPSIFKPV
jgi:putative nucleotidyltransferase with HDIG domain